MAKYTRKHSSRAKVITRNCVPDEIAQILQNAPTTRKAKAQSISLYNCAFGLSCLAWLTSMELYKQQEALHHVYSFNLCSPPGKQVKIGNNNRSGVDDTDF